MNEQEARLRQRPDDRFAAPLHHIDLAHATAELSSEAPASPGKHRQETLYKHGHVTIALFKFERGAQMLPHVAAGVVTVQVLKGRLKMTAEGKSHEVSTGQLLVMAPGVLHDVLAEEPTQMLLTVCLKDSAIPR